MNKFRRLTAIYAGFVLLGIAVAAWLSGDPEYAYSPPESKIINPESSGGLKAASADTDMDQLAVGRESFFTGSFGNEVFFSDIMGLFDGPMTMGSITEAIAGLRGQGTSNLKVKAAKEAVIGGTVIHKGDLIETGLDVAKGSYSPLGIRLKLEDGRAKAGISCLVCHATVDDRSGKVALGVPNSDLNIGYVLAMASNTAAYFTHTDIQTLQTYMKDVARTVPAEDGSEKVLPDPDMLEEAVDQAIMKWPKGSNDTTIDFHNNPVQIPDAITKGDHPYGWSGQGVVGPFRGLTAAINNAHAQNMDALSQSEIAGPVMQIDKEVYIGTILQRAAYSRYRYDPATGVKPSDFFATVDPTPGMPGVNRMIPSPNYPKISYMSAVGLFNSDPGYKAWEQGNAMSAWMNSLIPPEPLFTADEQTVAKGKQVFAKAECLRCHAGAFYTNNRILPVEEIGTEPSRAAAFKKTERYFDPKPQVYKTDTTVPLPANPGTEAVTISEDERKQLELAWAQSPSKGGYKVPSLFALSWTAPYLHDGGVAVGPDADKDLGGPGTWLRNVRPDPYNSLKALVDRKLRQRVMDANKAAAALDSAHVSGEGHNHWVDEEAGFTREEQDALIRFLLTIKGE
jgi:hypothetical protein